MSDFERQAAENRLLVLAPTTRDAALTRAIFERAGLSCLCCPDLDCVCDELELGAAAVVLPEECFVAERQHRLFDWIDAQEPWSDLPMLVLARKGADSPAVARAMDLLGNVTVVERPTRVSALVSAARSALRARQRQYQIREHLAEREQVTQKLLADDRRKDEFLAILAHELRNPLAPLVNSVQLLRLAGDRQAGAAKVHEMMDRQIRQLVRLVDDLLEVSRITRGKIELRRETTDLAGILRAAVESVRPMIDAAGHDLAVSMPELPILVEVDTVRLGQVFANLLSNAAKYTDAGGRIRVRVETEGATVTVAVRDNGCGIAPEMLPRVFDLFTQAGHDSTSSHGGLGIGLTLVQRLVGMHSGTVSAYSEGAGTGSEFVVTLPLADDGARSAPADRHRGDQRFEQQKILVVDDNRDAADSLAALLRMLGAQVEAVYGGTEALKKLESYHPSVVLLDLGMPEMDGLEVARRVRRRPEYGDVALVALTGWGQERDRHRTKTAGFDHHLTKPTDLEALGSLLDSLARPTPDHATSGSA